MAADGLVASPQCATCAHMLKLCSHTQLHTGCNAKQLEVILGMCVNRTLAWWHTKLRLPIFALKGRLLIVGRQSVSLQSSRLGSTML